MRRAVTLRSSRAAGVSFQTRAASFPKTSGLLLLGSPEVQTLKDQRLQFFLGAPSLVYKLTNIFARRAVAACFRPAFRQTPSMSAEGEY
jgi:hypothetical protein